MLRVCILLMLFIELAFGCGSSPRNYYDDVARAETSKERQMKREALAKTGRDNFGGFNVDAAMADKWINFWYRNRREQDAEAARNLTEQDKIDDDRTPEKGWPISWNGLNFGDSGVKDIPPWGWVPVNDQSLPTYCFLYLDPGNSTGIGLEVCNTQDRYAYNPFLKDCLKFEYLGCGGNTNNFVNIEDCTDQCMPHPSQGGCDPNVMQLISTLSDLDEEWGEGS